MPTLIIGLGGTGTEIIRRIRRRWGSSVPQGVALGIIDAWVRFPQGGAIDDVVFMPVLSPVMMTRSFEDPEPIAQSEETGEAC